MTPDFSVEIDRVTKRFGDQAVVDDVRLDIRRGEFFALLGPSGCGKTTLLRMIAGLETPCAGTIRIGGVDMTGRPPHQRPVNLVFQQYALFPHLTVRQNVAFGLPYKGLSKEAQERQAESALALVRLEGFGERRPHQLSGGQRQRVALARALALEPQVLLLDEPLAALDPNLRREVQVELKALQRKIGITFLFVTHDREEALALSDRIAVLDRGRVEQCAPPRQIFERPESEFVARFFGTDNFFTARVVKDGSGRTLLRLPDGLEFAAPEGLALPAEGATFRFLVRPEKLRLAIAAPTASEVAIPVTIEGSTYQGTSTEWVVLDGRGERLRVFDQNAQGRGDAPSLRSFQPGQRLYLHWDPRHIVPMNGPMLDGGTR